ncbi:site-specific integrase [Bacillus sp. CMF21]|nr:site-specific integrase [Bacillus sp. CMF21]
MIEDQIQRDSTTILEALQNMKDHRYWSDTTWESYKNDVKSFGNFLMDNGYDPLLVNGEKLHLVNQWIVEQKKSEVAYKTTTRRIAALSSVYSFYKELGIVKSNPFKASRVPLGQSSSHSRVLTMDELKTVYRALESLKTTEGIDIEIPVKLLMFTGLRNHSLTALKVENIKWDEELIVYDYGVDNYKHKVQLLPIPPVLLKRLTEFINELGLKPEEHLCYGIKGYPLKNKQLNFITNRINEYLGWQAEDRITPHGFRYTIATLLDEKGLSIENIQYLLGHSDRQNIRHYILRDQRKIFSIRKALTEIEGELERGLMEKKQVSQGKSEFETKSSDIPPKLVNDLPYSEEFILQLSQNNPELLEKLMLQHYDKM